MGERLSAGLWDALPEAIFVLDTAGVVRLVNRPAVRTLGRPAGTVEGRPLTEFLVGDPAAARAFLDRCARTSSPVPGRLHFATDGGSVALHAEGAAAQDGAAGRLIVLRCVDAARGSQLFRDLDAKLAQLYDELHHRRRLQGELEQALKEREVLLKEVHHRVRNNLQVITSFLSLQAREVSSDMGRLALREAQARIRALGLIHGQLYSEDNLGEVDLGKLVPALCNQLASVYGVSLERVRFAVRLPSWSVDLSRAVPLALLITEAVTNVLKHAFPGDRRGTVRIDLEQRPSGRTLRIRDDGVGLGPELRARARSSLGMRLMQALADQVDARLEIGSPSGVEVRLTLPAEPAELGLRAG